MRKNFIFLGGLLGSITSLAVMALLYLGDVLARLPFVPFDIFDWLARNLPGDVVTLGIDTIVNLIITLSLTQFASTSEVAKFTEQLMALALFVIVSIGLGGVVAWLLTHLQRPGWQIGGLGGFVLFLLSVGVEVGLGNLTSVLPLLWLLVVMVGWGVLLGQWFNSLISQPAQSTPESQRDRRSALIKMAGGSVAVALGAWGLGYLFRRPAASTGAGQPLNLQPTPAEQASTLRRKQLTG